MIIGDFHTHINGGGDKIENAMFIACEAVGKGFTHIALGCHEWVCPKKLAKYVEDSFDIIVVRFAECWCSFGGETYDDHLLALNIDDDDKFYREKYKPVEWYIEHIHRLGGKAVLAHPDTEKTFHRTKNLLDGVEIVNGRSGGFGYVKDSGLQLFRNSDFHAWEDERSQYGKIFTELPDEWFGDLR